MMRVVAALSVLTIMSACVSPTTTSVQRSDVSFRPDNLGLSVDPIGKRIDFGRSPAGAIRAVDRELGPHRALTLLGCSAGITQQLAWDDLVLTFTRERFVGWKTATGSQGRTCT
ncbi:hypothetical protein [Aliiroseovarius sp. 2305UL8-7]|uniref:hypothetical protein n=1 Tax=Aliiroseovarius conchicola TaxID=3121637 RepID=UPI003527CC72